MHVKISLLFPSEELLAQVDDSVLSKFICDVFSSFTGFCAKMFCAGASWDADACKGHMCISRVCRNSGHI